MSHLKEIIGSLENKVSKLVHRLEGVKENSALLKKELDEAKKTCDYAKSQATYWEDKYNALKLAQSMLGSDENTTEAKLNINTLIKELDYCIGALSK
mgnify:FL=1